MPKVCLLRKENFSWMVIDRSIQQMFTERLLDARHGSRHWGCSQQTKTLVLGKWNILVDSIGLVGFFGVKSLCRDVLFCLSVELEKKCLIPDVQRSWVAACQ